MKPVLCFGDICPDLIIPYGASLEFKDGVLVDPDLLSVKVSHGGSVANTCVGIARQDVRVMFCGTVGDDGYGRMLYDGLVQEGVDVTMFRKDPDCQTVLVLIVMDRSGERMTFACPRKHASQHCIRSEQVPSDIEDRIGWLHTAGITLREPPACDVQLDLMRRCRQKGVPVSLDINVRVEALQDPVFSANLHRAIGCCDILLGSGIDEIVPLCGVSDVKQAARSLTAGGRIVVSRDGAKGATVYQGEMELCQKAFPVSVRDAVGAGDAYNAGFISARMRGLDLADCNRYACATAAYCVTGDGGRSTPDPVQLNDFLRQYSMASK